MKRISPASSVQQKTQMITPVLSGYFSRFSRTFSQSRFNPKLDLTLYIVNRVKIPYFVLNVFWIYTCLQNVFCSYFPITYLRKSKTKLSNMFKVIQNCLLLFYFKNDSVSPDFPLLIVMIFELFTIFLELFVSQQYKKNAMINTKLLYFYVIFETLYYIPLSPVIYSIFGSLISSFFEAESELNYVILIFPLIVLCRHMYGSYDYLLNRNYFIFHFEVYNTTKYWVYFISFGFIPSSACFIFNNNYSSQFFFPNLFIIIICGLFIIACVITFPLFNHFQYASALGSIVTCLATCITSISIHNTGNSNLIILVSFLTAVVMVIGLNIVLKALQSYSIKQVKNPDFVKNCKTGGFTACLYSYAQYSGIKEIILCQHSLALYYKFKENPLVALRLIFDYMCFKQAPIELQSLIADLYVGIDSDFFFPYIYEYYVRVKGPDFPAEMEMHQDMAHDIIDQLEQCIISLKQISNIIFREYSEILVINALKASSLVNDTMKNILEFAERYPKSPYSRIFYEILLRIYAFKPVTREIRWWLNYDYPTPLATMPQLTDKLRGSLDAQSQYIGTNSCEYGEMPQESQNEILNSLRTIPKHSEVSSGLNGPYHKLFKNFFFDLALVFLFLGPFIFECVMYRDALHQLNYSDALEQCYMNLQNLSFLYSMSPILVINKISDKFEGTKFELTHSEEVIEKMRISIRFFNLLILGNQNFQLACPHFSGDLLNIMTQVIEYNGEERTLMSLLNTVAISIEEVISGELHEFIDRASTLDFYASPVRIFLEEVLVDFGQLQGHIPFYDKIPTIVILVPYYVIVLLIFVFIVLMLKYAEKKTETFCRSLNTLSKSPLQEYDKRMTEAQKILPLIKTSSSRNPSSQEKNDDSYYLPSLKLSWDFVIPAIGLLILYIIAHGFIWQLFRCHSLTILRRNEVNNNLTNDIFRISRVTIRVMAFLNDLSSYTAEEISSLIDEVLSFEYMYTPSSYKNTTLCKLCSIDKNIGGNTFGQDTQYILYMYLQLSKGSLTMDQSDQEALQSVYSSLQTEYFHRLMPIFMQLCTRSAEIASRDAPKLEMWIFILIIFTLFVGLLFVWFILHYITIANSVYSILITLLANLGKADMNDKIIDLLDNSNIDEIEQTQHISPVYYSLFRLQMNGAVIVIDYLMNIIAINREASHFFVDDQLAVGSSLFEVMSYNFIDDESGFTLRHIIDQYLWDDINIISEHKVSGTSNNSNEKETCNCVIIPIFSEKLQDRTKDITQSPYLVLVFTNNSEEKNIDKALEENKKKPKQIVMDWTHPMIANYFMENHQSQYFYVRRGAVACVYIKGLTVQNKDIENSIELIDLIIRRFDIIVSTHKYVTKLRTMSSKYYLGSNIFECRTAGSSCSLDIINCCSDLQREVEKLSKSKGIELQLICSAAIEPLSGGISGPQHPWLDIWGDSVTTTADLLKYGRVGEIAVNKLLYDLAVSEGLKNESINEGYCIRVKL